MSDLSHKTRGWLEEISAYNVHRFDLDRKHSALLVIDMQNYFIHPEGNAFIPEGQDIIPNIQALQKIFRKPIIEATKIMLDVHRKGIGVVGIYTYDVARTKTMQVHAMAREREFPLQCSFEKA